MRRYKVDHSELDKLIRKRRAQGLTWAQIADLCGCSQTKIIARAKATGLMDPAKQQAGLRGFETWKARKTEHVRD